MVYDDQLAALRKDSAKKSSAGGEIDYSLLVDGLLSEREQGITIDVAYRYFATEKRKFIIADTPGHEQYTRNMATGASHRRPGHHPHRRALRRAPADAAPQLHRLAARHPPRGGGGEQDGSPRLRPGGLRRHLRGLRGLRREARPPRRPLPAALGAQGRQRRRPQRAHALVPGAAAPRLPGDGAHRARRSASSALRFPVQYVLRPDLDFRGFSGTLASGVVRRGDRVHEPAVGARQHRGAHRHPRRRPRRGGRPAGRHPHARGRDRRQPRRHARPRWGARRPPPRVPRHRGHGGVDAPDRDAARRHLPDQARHQGGLGGGDAPSTSAST